MADDNYKANFKPHVKKAYETLSNDQKNQEIMALRHMKGLVHVAEKHGYDSKTDIESFNLTRDKSYEERRNIADDLSDYFAAKGYEQLSGKMGHKPGEDFEANLKKVKEFRENDKDTYNMFMRAHSRITHPEIQSTMEQFGEDFINQYSQKVLPQVAQSYSQELTQQYTSDIKHNDVSDILKETGAHKHFDENNIERQHAIQILAEYAKTGHIGEEWAKKQPFYFKKKK